MNDKTMMYDSAPRVTINRHESVNVITGNIANNQRDEAPHWIISTNDNIAMK